MYNRDMVVALIKEVYPSDKYNVSLYASGKVYKNLDEWIEENL